MNLKTEPQNRTSKPNFKTEPQKMQMIKRTRMKKTQKKKKDAKEKKEGNQFFFTKSDQMPGVGS